jgi:hypothetical protein
MTQPTQSLEERIREAIKTNVVIGYRDILQNELLSLCQSEIDKAPIGFAEWIVKEYWRYFEDEKLWFNMVDNTIDPYTTFQLYNLYKQQP